MNNDFALNEDSLNQLRKQISQIDEQIIQLIAERQDISKAIGEYKKLHNLPIKDATREQELHTFHKSICSNLGISSTMIQNIFTLIIGESRTIQKT